jgi:hypothetical protein
MARMSRGFCFSMGGFTSLEFCTFAVLAPGAPAGRRTAAEIEPSVLLHTDDRARPASAVASCESIELMADQVKDLGITLERDLFLRMLVRDLAGTLQDVVGLREASGFVSIVGQQMGEYINQQYTTALHKTRLDRGEVRDVLVDLKRRIQGDFYVIEESEDRVVLGNRMCPFGDKVIGRPAMCMMTSNVFGAITAKNLGYAKVELRQTIAQGAPECRVIVHVKNTPDAERAEGREYVASEPSE